MKVIRCGQPRYSRKKMAPISEKDVKCLEGYWSLEEQLGLRKKPRDDFLSQIPKITLRPQIQEGPDNG